MLLDIANSGNVLVCIASLSLQNRPASFDGLRMRWNENGICLMPLRKAPHPEPVEGRIASNAADVKLQAETLPKFRSAAPLYPARRGIRFGITDGVLICHRRWVHTWSLDQRRWAARVKR
jgi:hypothetical protein